MRQRAVGGADSEHLMHIGIGATYHFMTLHGCHMGATFTIAPLQYHGCHMGATFTIAPSLPHLPSEPPFIIIIMGATYTFTHLLIRDGNRVESFCPVRAWEQSHAKTSPPVSKRCDLSRLLPDIIALLDKHPNSVTKRLNKVLRLERENPDFKELLDHLDAAISRQS